MNAIRTTVFLLALALSGGCTSLAPNGLDLPCAGKPETKIRISYKKNNSIVVKDPYVEVNPGEAIKYKVTGPIKRTFNAKGTSGPSSFGWLDMEKGEGGPGGRPNYICVPDNQKDGEYTYEIEIVGVGTLDPKVQVN